MKCYQCKNIDVMIQITREKGRDYKNRLQEHMYCMYMEIVIFEYTQEIFYFIFH